MGILDEMMIGPEHSYGCYRCGRLQGKVIVDHDDKVFCGECNEQSIVTFTQALDILNDHYRANIAYNMEVEYEEEELEFIRRISEGQDIDEEA